MVFKPFKPPSIRKPPTQTPDSSADSITSTSTSTRSDDGPPPTKRPRLLSRTSSALGNGIGTATTRPALTGQRKPLLQVRNEVLGSAVLANGSGDADEGYQGEEKYFNVLWRKPTAKKNKTWDGDGIISTRDGYVYLQDVSGREMGRVMYSSSALKPGVMLSIGGKEVEVNSKIERKEYLSGKRHLPGQKEVKRSHSQEEILIDEKPAPPKKAYVPLLGNRTRNAASKPSTARTQTKERTSISSGFKQPLLESTIMPPPQLDEPTPRHDPKQPGALIMQRPDSVPKGRRIVDVVVDPLLGKHLRPHQREGVKFLYECVMGMRSFNGEGAILADDMGLGKTLQTITLLWTLLKQNPIYEASSVIKKALIVCPVTLINNWRKEFRKWLGNERIGVFVFDDKRKRLTDFTMGKAYSVMIVGYEKLRTVQEGLARGNGVDIVIADEGHRLKTLQNKSGQAIQSLNATKRIILSGTPIQNDLKEFFAAVDLVNPGVLGSFKSFVKEFEVPIVRSRQPEATEKDIEKGEARNEELRELTSKFMLRRTADILAKYLPPKTEYVLFCKPTNTQAKIYQSVLESPVFQSVIGSSESALQLITILKKLCNSPSLLSPKNGENAPSETIAALLSSLPPNLLRHFSPSTSAKIRVLDQLLHHLRTSTSEKIVLVSNYTSTLTLLANLLSSLSLPFLRLDGSTPAQKRQGLVEDFNRLPANLCFAFLLSAKAGGTGLNLIGASRLVLFDVDWNPATDIQAMARIHRDGQKRPCHIYRILLKGSLEEKIWQRQVTKLGLADSVMEHKDSVAQFSRDELKDLFRLDVESVCQTHDLLACSCRGSGSTAAPSGASSPRDLDESIAPSDGENQDEINDTDDDDDDLTFPDINTLMKASEVDMEKQERRIASKIRAYSKSKSKTGSNPQHTSTTTNPATNSKQKIQETLSAYAHIDPALFLSPTLDQKLNPDPEQQSLEQLIDDEVLLTLLKDEENRVGFLFKKSTKPEIKDGDDALSPVTAESESATPIPIPSLSRSVSRVKSGSASGSRAGSGIRSGTAASPVDLSD
ncbi:SNF2 family N-terminal domain-containing protein [Aspergillus pseudodeflectus]|uniref:SNF2 family N-terminal domain-containing protein n=1 Tax=Aspergillus pseudodeflectus TaxID=176178 RepID=A0ABR4L235_9EURO